MIKYTILNVIDDYWCFYKDTKTFWEMTAYNVYMQMQMYMYGVLKCLFHSARTLQKVQNIACSH